MMTGWVIVSRRPVKLCGRAGTGAAVGTLYIHYLVADGFCSQTIQCFQAREHRAITCPLSAACPCLWFTVKYSNLGWFVSKVSLTFFICRGKASPGLGLCLYERESWKSWNLYSERLSTNRGVQAGDSECYSKNSTNDLDCM